MMATEIIKIDASWAEKWTKTGVPFLSAPTVQLEQFFLKASLTEEECSIRIICRVEHGQGPRVPARCTMHLLAPYIDIPKRRQAYPSIYPNAVSIATYSKRILLTQRCRDFFGGVNLGRGRRRS